MQELQSNFLGRMNQELHTGVCVESERMSGVKAKEKILGYQIKMREDQRSEKEGEIV